MSKYTNIQKSLIQINYKKLLFNYILNTYFKVITFCKVNKFTNKSM